MVVVTDPNIPTEELQALSAAFETGGIEAMYRVLLTRTADWVEVRHTPAAAYLDGWRDADTFKAYIEEEILAMPKAYSASTVSCTFSAEPGIVAIDPYVRAGTLVGSGIEIEMTSRVEMHFDQDGRLYRIVGTRKKGTPREQVMAWLAAMESVGGFNPPPPQRT